MPPAHCRTIVQCIYSPTLILLGLIVLTAVFALLIYIVGRIRDAYPPLARSFHADQKDRSVAQAKDDVPKCDMLLHGGSENLAGRSADLTAAPV